MFPILLGTAKELSYVVPFMSVLAVYVLALIVALNVGYVTITKALPRFAPPVLLLPAPRRPARRMRVAAA
jgi:hypothetical protein